MIFTGFKRKSNQLFFNKHIHELVANLRKNDSKKAKNVLVFVDDISAKLVILEDLKRILKISEIEIDVLVFDKKNTKNNADESVFSPKDFGWYGKVKSERLNHILTKKYDLLINYSKVENIYINVLLLQCETAFNVGFSHLDNRLYDLLIKCNNFDIVLFNKELEKYLAILNKI